MKTRAAIACTMALIGFIGCTCAEIVNESSFFVYAFIINTVGTAWTLALFCRHLNK